MANIENIAELSPAQQGILFHSLYTPESGVYLIQTHTKLQGRLDAGAFAHAWNRVVERHPILRTFFMWEGTEKPVQVVLHDAVPAITMVDIRDLNPDEQADRVSVFLADDRKRGFDLSEAPLMRLALIRTGDDTWEFVWTAHHLIVDGWSTHLILKEAFLLHEAYCRGQEPQLAYSRPFSDYIAWLQKQDMSRAEAYWKRTLAGWTAPTPLMANGFAPVGRAEAAAGSGEEHAVLPAEVMASLTAMAREHHLTVNTLVQGAWALLLHRYSGAAEVLFGTTLSGRPVDLPGAEAIVGMFINTLPIKVPVPPRETVTAWLSDVQARHAELREYEYTPLVDVQGWSEIPRGTGMFDSLLIFENYPTEVADRAREAGLQVGQAQAVEWTNYALTIFATPGVDLRIKVMYDRSLIDQDSASRLVRHFRTLLAAIAANPEQRLSELPMLTEGEERQQLVSWNETVMAWPDEACVHELVAAQAARTPDRVAVVCEGEALTFDQLNRRANQVAHYLRKQGVGPEVMVGICTERSLAMLVGQLGILKAGGAYVPLDPAYPQERLAFMMADAGMPVLLTQQRLVAGLPAHGAQVVCLDSDWAEIARESEANPDSGVGAGNLAYVIYTSGSTGKPKGVQLEHRSVVNFLTAMRREPGLTEADVLVAVTPISFDIAVLEQFLPLTVGARVVIA
ncbi:MAG: putative linear pentadecapeptide gramicidin synthetase LgrB, partial [Firmicutes bacterium]|nr:putative linear pentadecapeptide gramicidin synthetase LgrB [Bacillota bacterium]